MNLISNAIKFTDEGSVTVSLEEQDGATDEAGWVRLAVRDTGVGIASDDRDRMFAPFTQLEGAGDLRVGGTGLEATVDYPPGEPYLTARGFS